MFLKNLNMDFFRCSARFLISILSKLLLHVDKISNFRALFWWRRIFLIFMVNLLIKKRDVPMPMRDDMSRMRVELFEMNRFFELSRFTNELLNEWRTWAGDNFCWIIKQWKTGKDSYFWTHLQAKMKSKIKILFKAQAIQAACGLIFRTHYIEMSSSGESLLD